MIRRLFKTGNSIVVSIPKELLDSLKLSEGQSISLELDPTSKHIILSPVAQPLAIAGVTKEFSQQISDFIEQYRPALEELAR